LLRLGLTQLSEYRVAAGPHNFFPGARIEPMKFVTALRLKSRDRTSAVTETSA
jgi:hypothetical protein